MTKEEMIEVTLTHLASLYRIRKASSEKNQVLEQEILLNEKKLTALGCLDYKELDM